MVNGWGRGIGGMGVAVGQTGSGVGERADSAGVGVAEMVCVLIFPKWYARITPATGVLGWQQRAWPSKPRPTSNWTWSPVKL